MKLIDLTLPLEQGSLSYPGTASGVNIERLDVDVEGITVSVLRAFDPHCGTHLDAPLHFVSGAADTAAMPLLLPTIVLIESIQNPIPLEVLEGLPPLEGKAIVFSTDWETHAGTSGYFVDYPTLSEALVKQLVAENVALVGVDSPSVDVPSGTYVAHRMLLAAGIPILEGLVNLAALSALIKNGREVRLVAFPLSIRGLEGSPVRAVAVVD